MEFITILFWILILIFATVALIKYYEKKRSEKFKAVADQLHLSFSRMPDNITVLHLRDFYIFSRGHSLKVSNYSQGSVEDINLKIFDYQYTRRFFPTLKNTIS